MESGVTVHKRTEPRQVTSTLDRWSAQGGEHIKTMQKGFKKEDTGPHFDTEISDCGNVIWRCLFGCF
jgi:hypothetical protein